MNYKVEFKNNKWAVVETRSGLIIECYATERAARKIVRKLNLGAGFDGWTPPFIASKEAV